MAKKADNGEGSGLGKAPASIPAERTPSKSNTKKSHERPAVNAVPDSSRMIHQFMPYILVVATLFLIACFIFSAFDGAMGSVGKWLRDFLCGMFGFSAFFTPLILINLAVFWRKYVDMRMVSWKLGLSLVTLIFISSLFHVCSIPKIYGDTYSWLLYATSIFGRGDAVSNWTNGLSLKGGGFFGGLFGGFSRCTVGFVGSLILLIATIIICIMFLFSVTPGYVWSGLRTEIARLKEKRLARKEAIAEEEARLRKEAEAAEEKERRIKRNLNETAPQKKSHRNVIEDDAPDVAEVPYITGVLEGNGRTRDWSPAAAGFQAGTGDKAYSPDKKPDKKELPPEGIPVITPPSPDAPVAVGPVPVGQPVPVPVSEPVIADIPAPEEKDSVKILDDVLAGVTAAPSATGEGSRIRKKAEKVNTSDTHTAAAAMKVSDPAPASKPSSLPDILKKMVPVSGDANDNSDVEPETDTSLSDAEKTSAEKLQAYFFPPIELLHEVKAPSQDDIAAELRNNAQKIMDKLAAFNVGIKKIEYSRGPTITRYELYPEANTRVRSIAGLADDIALELAATIRLEAPIPNKNAVGVEVPNQVRALVPIRELIDSEKFKSMGSKLSSCLGKDVGGNMVFFDIGKMPHLLIAGTTGSGKSVCLNTIIMSLLYKSRPDEVQFIMIDPKKIEMSMYNNLPHLKVPVVTDMKRAAGTLNAAVNEMEHRYELFEDCGSRDLDNYNKFMMEGDPGFVPLPRLVIIIDELADLMMSAPQQIEASIIRLAQKARAAGIHLIIGTQRPSVNVITGLIKANVPSRIAFSVVSNVESRIIIDIAGAEKLIGKGDMLFAPIGCAKPSRIQGAFVDDDEVRAVTEFIKKNSSPVIYDDEFISDIDRETDRLAAQENHGKTGEEEPAEFVQDADPLFNNALHVAVENGTVATSSLQRRLSIGFGRAAKIIDRMEALGFVSPANGTKPRNVMLTKQQLSELEMAGDCRVQGRFN